MDDESAREQSSEDLANGAETARTSPELRSCERNPAKGLSPAAETELVETELVETELVETELVETELVETELVETEIVETEIVETEIVEAEIVEALLVEAMLVDDEPLPAPALRFGSAECAEPTDYIAAEIVAEIVDDPPVPAIRISADASQADYDHEARVRKFDRGGITAGSHRYRRRGRRLSLLLASGGFLFVLGLFALIKFAAELPEREEFAETWQNERDWYENEAWRQESDGRGSEAARREALRKLYEDIERIQDELEANANADSTDDEPPIENLDEAILADADWPDSALSLSPLASIDEPLRRRDFDGEQRTTEYFSTTQTVAGDGLRARHTRIISPFTRSKLIDAAWSADGKAIYTLDASGFVTKVFVDPLNAALTTRIANAVGVEVCQAGVLVARPSTLLVLDPATLAPRDQFIGLVCEEAAAGVDGSRVVLAGLGKLSVLDLQRNILTHRVDRAASRAFLDGPYRRSDLAAEFKSPAVWPDGESFFALSDGRACQFYFEGNSLYLTYVGPRRGRVRATAVGSASEGDGLFLMEPIPIVPTPIVPSTSAPDPSPDGSEAAWFAAYSPEDLFDTATIQERIVGVAKSGAENGPAFFLSQSGRCSRSPAQDNRLLGQVDLLGNGESAELSLRYCGIVADPRHPRAAVFNDESLWIVESAVDDNADAAE